MSWNSRRASVILTAVGLLVVMSLLQVQTLKGQREIPIPGGPPTAQPKKDDKVHDLGRLTLTKDNAEDLKQLLDAAEDRVKEKDWAKACDLLQKQVGRSNDYFVPRERKDAEGNTTLLYVSIKKEAIRLIGTLPEPGRKYYKDKFGPSAEKDLKQAKTNNNYEQMAKTLSLYMWTDEGAEAASWLATHQLDRGNFQGASTFFQILIGRSGISTLGDGQLVKAAFAFHHAGDPASLKFKDLAIKELQKRKFEKLGNFDSVASFEESLNKFVASVSASENASDSPVYRGRASRNAVLAGGTPFLEPQWSYKLAYPGEKEETTPEKQAAATKTAEFIKQALDGLATGNKYPFSGFTPVTATATTRTGKRLQLLVFRNYEGVMAVNVTTGERVWEADFDSSLQKTLGGGKDANKRSAYQQWWDAWKPHGSRPSIFFENSIQGTLSADHRHVYAIEDLPLPAPQNLILVNPNFGGGPSYGADIMNSLNSNKLYAIGSVGGGVKWEAGGSNPTDEPNKEILDSVFLGPPLPLNGKLYVLNEKQQELRLVTLDPDGAPGSKAKVLGVQPLATMKDLKIGHDPLRRVQAAHLAHGEGILVIPTNAGAVFGIDLLTGSLAWAYPYGQKVEEAPNQGPNFGGGFGRGGFGQPPGPGWVWVNGRWVKPDQNTHWHVTAPAIQDGKAVFTAPDARDLHCISLREGTRIWSRPREENDLFLAGVFNGKVVIVGKQRTRALNLTTGQLAWELETGEPSGQGAASLAKGGNDVLYYLPIRKATATNQPEICTINVEKGRIHAHTRSRKGEIPGNLLFYEGRVMSQNHEMVTAYPQLERKLDEINVVLKNAPDNLTAMVDRGDYLLDRGDLLPAIQDFRTALRHEKINGDNPDISATRRKARAKLYEAYTEYFQFDFNKAEEYLKDYEEMCKVEKGGLAGEALTEAKADERRRRANYLCLVGKGRENQNKLVEAFQLYLELGLESQKGELIQVVDEPSVKAAPDVWSQGRIASMIARSTDAKQKAAVEELIKSEWAKIRNDSDLEKLRKFVAMFGSLFGVGKEARFSLAERLMDQTEINAILEAEQHLTMLRQDPLPEVAAKAIETLARLNTRKGLLEDAAHYYRILAEKYPKILIDGKEGAEHFEDLANDKRFLPYLDQSGRYIIKGAVKLEFKEEKGNHYTPNWNYPLHNYGEGLPFFMRNRLMMDYGDTLKLTDGTNPSEPRWSLKLSDVKFENIATTTNNAKAYRMKFGFQTQGHLVITTLGHRVFAIDPLNKGRVVWEKNLSEIPGSATTAPSPLTPLTYDQRDGSVLLKFTDGAWQRLGGDTGALQGGVVCLQYRDRMEVVDPVSSRTLWTRADVNSRAHVLGDGSHIYVVGMTENNQPTGSRVFRAYDGVTVRVPDFSSVYEKRVRVMGRHILASEVNGKGQLNLRIYDILEGKDLWNQQFAAGSTMMQSEDPGLAGVLEPNGDIRVVDVATQKEIIKASLTDITKDGQKLGPKNWSDTTSVHLLADPDYLFIALNNKLDSNKVGLLPGQNDGNVQPNFTPGRGLRSIPVNGYMACYNRDAGKLRWAYEVEHEQLVVTQFEELPLLFFAAKYMKWSGPVNAPRNQQQVSTVQVLAKHNGKMWYMPDGGALNPAMSFLSVNMDHRTGQVTLTGDSMKIQLTARPR